MGRIMTLRGNWDVSFGVASAFGATGGRLIFEYESSDRTRAWRVKKACVNIQEATGTGGGDSRALFQCALLTDQIDNTQSKITSAPTANRYQRCLGPSDNRSIAWSTTDMILRDNVTADWIAPHGNANPSWIEMVCDADRLVTNELYILSYGVTESGTYTWTGSYYIELEEVKLTPSESLFAQLKGTGQEVGPQFRGFPTS